MTSLIHSSTRLAPLRKSVATSAARRAERAKANKQHTGVQGAFCSLRQTLLLPSAAPDPCLASSSKAEGGPSMEGDGGDGTSKAEPQPSSPAMAAMAAAPVTITTATAPTITPSDDSSSFPNSSSTSASASPSSQARPQSTVAGLAKEAAQLFHARSYQGCLLILHQLQLHNDEDPKIRHNIAVAEYYRDGCTNPQKLLEVLAQVKARNEELARAAEEQQEGNSSASTSGSTNGSGGNGGLSSTARTAGADVVAYMEDYDTSIPNLNNAVIMYHLQRYAAAMSVLEPLYRNIEPIDETAALRVCLLMLDITLASGQPGKAAEILQYMEKAFGYLLPPVETSSAAPTVPSSTPSETELLITSTEQNLARTSSDEVLEEDPVVLGSLEIDPGQSRAAIAPVIAAREKPIPPVDVKLLLHLYRVRLFLSARNLKASKREIKSALNLSRENAAALLLKAQLEYSRGNYRKAIKQLTMCLGRADPGIRGILLSNLGCIHHRLRKDQVAALYFRKALQATSERSDPLSVQTFSQDRSLPIVYNAGLQQLSCGNPILASRCFQEAAALYYNRPLLWLRLAECCIVALEKGLLENTTTSKREVAVTIVGDGAWRRLVLPGGSLNPTLLNGALGLNLDESEGDVQVPDGSEKWFVSGKSHKLSLSFAIQCLQIAICLFDRCDARAAEAAAEAAVAAAEVGDGDDTPSSKGVDSKGGNSPTGEPKDSKSLVSAVTTFEEHKVQETAALRMWALAALSYCQLGVGHPLRALRSAEQLLRQPSCARPYMLLGHVYAAEALCQLERPEEALEHLSTCLTETTAEPTNSGTEDESSLKCKSGDNSEASVDGEDSASYTVGALGDAASVARLTGTSARASLYINLVAVYAMQGNLQEAHRLAQEAQRLSPSNPTALLAAVYVELKRERMESALTLLKQYRHLCVVSSSKGLSQHD